MAYKEIISDLFTSSKFKANIKSGFTVSLISLPLSISLAVASGVSPIMGIITAIWAGGIAAIFGGSNYNIIAPTGAPSAIVAAYALAHGAENVPLLAITTGIIILIACLLRLERYLIFIPSSVIHGFILGVACIIGLNQLNFALGLHNLPKHTTFIENVTESLGHINQTSWLACALFITFFLTLLIVRKKLPSVPGAIIISPIGILVGYIITDVMPSGIETLATKFGTISPHFMQLPTLAFDRNLLIPASIIAFIALIETILSARIADTATKTKHHTRKEIFGLGLANIASGLMGGIPATAALARTALNIKSGATSRISALFNSFFLIIGSYLFLRYFSYIPMPVIAAILVYVAINMVERKHFYRLYYHDKTSFFIALLVAAVTVTQDAIVGILLGTVIALLILVNKLSQSYYEITVHESPAEHKAHNAQAQKRNILIYTFKGKLVYLNNQAHIMHFRTDFTDYAGIILVLDDLYFIDLDGVDALEEIIELIEEHHQSVMLVHPSVHIEHMLQSSKKFKELKRKGLVFDSLDAALKFSTIK